MQCKRSGRGLTPSAWDDCAVCRPRQEVEEVEWADGEGLLYGSLDNSWVLEQVGEVGRER